MVFAYLDFFTDASALKKRYVEGAVGDVEVKAYLFETLMTFFASARKAYEELKANPSLVANILKRGQERAVVVASQTMKNVREATGLVTKYSFQASNIVSIDEFARIEVRVGKVLEATNKEGSDKLIRLVVDVGESAARIIFTGVRGFGYTPEYFAKKQFFFITNLAPRKMLDEESQGMILAVDGADGKPQFISAEGMPIGAKIR